MEALSLTHSQLTPQLLKPAVADAIIDLTAPIREAFAKSPEWQEVALKAYPPPPPKQTKPKKDKKEKKEKKQQQQQQQEEQKQEQQQQETQE